MMMMHGADFKDPEYHAYERSSESAEPAAPVRDEGTNGSEVSSERIAQVLNRVFSADQIRYLLDVAKECHERQSRVDTKLPEKKTGLSILSSLWKK